jgi:hypothetical protein
MADPSSPSGGFFTDCLGCPAEAPMTADPCSNDMKDGAESAVDCGGGACEPCAVGQACAVASDCASALCEEQLCVTGISP